MTLSIAFVLVGAIFTVLAIVCAIAQGESWGNKTEWTVAAILAGIIALLSFIAGIFLGVRF